jgi:hypothetical protein
MQISRRKFAQKVGLAVVGAGLASSIPNTFSQSLGPGTLFPLPASCYEDSLMGFTAEIFAPFVGTIFRSDIDTNRTISLRLTEVVPHQHAATKSFEFTGVSFSLIFREIGRKQVEAGIYTLEHPSFQTFKLFISPIERGKLIYEAVISHP